MSAQCEVTGKRAAKAPLNFFERYLTAWVALCIVVGIALGQVLPGVFKLVGGMEIAKVNLPVGLLIWVMIIPMLLKIDFSALHQVKDHVKGIGVTLFVNWLVKPFSMAFLGWLFIRHVFAPMLPAAQIDSYIAGLILLAAAPCTAMVFVWSRLTDGDPYFTLSQVAVNDLIMVFAFAPLVGLLLGVSSITVPWDTLITSVVLYIVVPVIVAQIWRRLLLSKGQAAFDAAMTKILLRAGRRRRHQPVRFRFGRCAGDGGGRADRSTGNASGRQGRQRHQALVRSGRPLLKFAKAVPLYH